MADLCDGVTGTCDDKLIVAGTPCNASGASCTGASPDCPAPSFATACTSSCAANEALCGGVCTNITTTSNCGTCGNTCAFGLSCVNGSCTCGANELACNGTCIPSDERNCGACGNACPATATCSSGACVCPANTTVCSGACVNTSMDSANCGACGNVCSGGTSCSAGACVCPAGQTLYGGKCVADVVFGYLDGVSYAAGGTTFPSSGGSMSVRGWAVDTAPGQTVLLSVAAHVRNASGVVVAQLPLPASSLHQARPDVQSYFTTNPWGSSGPFPGNDFTNSGFNGTVTLPALPAGSYSVCAWAGGAPNNLSAMTNCAPITVGNCTTSTNCASNQTCTASFTCATSGCDASHPCNGGCCSGGTCQAGTASSSCGGNGATCDVCESTETCTNQTCIVPPPPAFDCDSCACGCTGTSCVAPVRCSAYACRKAGGYCDPCEGCVL